MKIIYNTSCFEFMLPQEFLDTHKEYTRVSDSKELRTHADLVKYVETHRDTTGKCVIKESNLGSYAHADLYIAEVPDEVTDFLIQYNTDGGGYETIWYVLGGKIKEYIKQKN